MRELATAVAVGLLVLGLLVWVGLGSEIIARFSSDSKLQPIELVVEVTAADTEAPLVGAKVVLGTLESRTLALDQYTIAGRRATDRRGLARFAVSLQQDSSIVVVSADGYVERRIAAPELWQDASYTEAGYEVAIALEPLAVPAPGR